MKITLIQVQLLLYIFTLPVSDIDHGLIAGTIFNGDWSTEHTQNVSVQRVQLRLKLRILIN